MSYIPAPLQLHNIFELIFENITLHLPLHQLSIIRTKQWVLKHLPARGPPFIRSSLMKTTILRGPKLGYHTTQHPTLPALQSTGCGDPASSFEKNRFLHVKGTPFIGKSTFLRLLHHHFKLVGREMTWACINVWPGEREPGAWSWPKFIAEKTEGRINTKSKEPFVLFIDEGQTSYWNQELWTYFIKQIVQDT